jgi:hypothetical protein
MAASAIEISNRALGRIGIDQLIESFDDPNPRARECRLHYEPCRDEVLQDFPWNFAQRCVALAPTADVSVPGWGYSYNYPADCVKVSRITGAGGQRLGGFAGLLNTEIMNYDAVLPRKIPFQVMAHPTIDGKRIILTDVPQAYAWFTTEVTDPSQFPPLFRSAVAWRMAMELALAMRAATALYNNAAQQYGWAVSQAQVGSLAEETPDRYPDSPSVAARL